MVSFTYENQGTKSFLINQMSKDQQVDALAMGMLSNNRVTGVLPVAFTQKDNDRFLQYDISSKVSLQSFFTGIVSRKRLLNILFTISNTILQSEEYLIESNMFVLDCTYIYANVSTSEASLVYLPVLPVSSENTSLSQFFKDMVFSTHFDQTENCDHIAKIMNFLNSSGQFSLLDFRNLIQEIIRSTQTSVESSAQKFPQSGSQEASVQYSSSAQEVRPAYQNVQSVSNHSDSPLTYNTLLPVSAAPNVGPAKKKGLFGLGKQKQEKDTSPNEDKKKNSKENIAPGNRQALPVMQVSNKNSSRLGGASPINNAIPGMAIPGRENVPGSGSGIPSSTFSQAVPNRTQYSQQGNQAVVSTSSVPVTASQLNSFQSISSPGFGGTTVLGAGTGETTLLGNNMANNYNQPVRRPVLVRIKTGEVITVDKPVFHIGKEKSYVDFFIGDNSAVSRSHADIIIKDNMYYIIDNNSTNHTYVDDLIISSNVQVQIEEGVIISFANEKFKFELR